MILSSAIATAQEKGKINGTVTLSGNTPAENISIVLKGSLLSAITNDEGQYEIKNIKPGTYTIRLSAIGIIAIEENVTVAAGETITRNFTLSESQEELDEIIIDGKGNKFARTKSEVVSKMPLKDIENPQVYNTISAEVLKEQVITNFDDALKNAPGIDKLWESTGRGGDGAGYYSLRGFAVQPNLINGVAALSNGSPDIANIERIEVIKGPSGTLFGSTLVSYGGLINITTKRPYGYFGGSVSYTGATYGLHRTTVDVNTPLNDDKTALLRLNAAYHTQNSFQDAGFKKSFFVAPSLSYEVSDKLSFLVNTEFYNGRSTNPIMLFVDRGSELRVHNIDELDYNNKRSYTSNDLYIDTPTFSLQGMMNYKLTNNWTSQTILSRTSAKSQGYYSYLYEGTSGIEAALGTTFDEGIILARYTSKQNSETYGTNIQQNFIGEFNIGSVKNKLVAGLDYYNTNSVGNSTGYGVQGFVNLGVDEAIFQSIAPALHAAYGDIPMAPMRPGVDDSGVLTQDAADTGIALSSGPTPTKNKTKQEIFSAYVSEVAYILPNLSAMASVRIDRFSNKGNLATTSDDYNQTAVSPKFGLVFQPVLNKVALFANYMNGFSNVAPITTPSGNILTFDPEQANQFEFGTKLNLLNDKVIANLSYYNIKVSNTVLQVSPEEYIQDGEQVNKGFEASVIASPIEGLNIIAGYSYNDSRLEKAEEGNDFAGKRPESAGPQNLANLWASYKFSSGALNGFGLGFGGNYGSKNMIFNRNLGGTFTLPEYTVLNASVFYNADAFTITLKLDNLNNEEYYKGWSTINPQMPRTFAANLTYNF